jgi:hypothetical protein
MKTAAPPHCPLSAHNLIAITMWDFSWLERRWPNAGYENWDLILDELLERGYNAVRIDAYPHLVAASPTREWDLLPCWNTQDWGAPARITVRVQPNLNTFIQLCADKGVRVALSTWCRRDSSQRRALITTPEQFAAAWCATLNTIAEAGLLKTILYVDLCNEWTHPEWAPVFHNPEPYRQGEWDSPPSLDWMRRALVGVRVQFPGIPLTFSTNSRPERFGEVDASFLDFLEPHLWIPSADGSDFYARVGYNFEAFDPRGYENLASRGEAIYRSNPEHWLGLLRKNIDRIAQASRQANRICITTEGWSMVDYKDWPMLDWGWVKEGCAEGVRAAVATGRWAGMCTSNFCGPQFRGMWRDVAWHQKLTKEIRSMPQPTS